MENNKVVLANGTVLLDLTDTTATASDVARGKYFYTSAGVRTAGTATSGVVIRDTTDSHGGTIREIISEDQYSVSNLSVTRNGTYDAPSGVFYDSVSVNVPSSQPTLQSKSATPTESAQTITPDSGYDGLSSVSVGAISSTYVGTGITRRSSTDLTATGATVTAPAGYYQSSASKTIPNATTLYGEFVGINANGDVSFDAEVDVGGYINSGTYRITDSGAITVRGVNDLSVSADTVTAPAGYYPQSVGTTVASGTAGTPTATKGSVSNHSVSVTPSVTNTTGYITGSTKTGTAVTVSASELVSGTLSITENGTGIDVANYQKVDVSVSGGGSSKNVQIAQGVNRVATTSYTAVSGQSLTVAVTGTYDVYWAGFRSSTGGTNGSRLYIGSSAYDSAQTTFSNNGQSVHLTNVSLTAGQTVAVYARARGTNYYMYVANLTIIQQ